MMRVRVSFFDGVYLWVDETPPSEGRHISKREQYRSNAMYIFMTELNLRFFNNSKASHVFMISMVLYRGTSVLGAHFLGTTSLFLH